MKVLVVEDDTITRLAVKSQLENPGNEMPVGGAPHLVTAVPGTTEAQAALDRENFDYAFIDLKLGSDRTAGKSLLRSIVRDHPSTICIMMTSNGADEAVEDCLKLGASEYIVKPFEERIVHIIMRKARIVHRLWQQNRVLRQGRRSSVAPIWLESKSPTFKRVLDEAKKLKGKQNIAIFIAGESGVGKDALARYLWTLEEDETRVFIPINMGAIPENLIESELFGYRKGAFSGATENKIGKFELADGGDIFLDEVADMPMGAQVKLLRVLQDKEIDPVGNKDPSLRKVNIRVISATNADLDECVAAKKFREDLLYRLRMLTLEIPPLRERMEDLENLVFYFLRKIDRPDKRLSSDAWALCRTHHWPGNVRELENALTVAAELTDGPEITAEDLQPRLQTRTALATEKAKSQHGEGTGPYGLSDECIQGNFSALTESFEQDLARFALGKAGSVTEASKYLKIPRTTLASKIAGWGWKPK